ncbi:hypothetical protein VE01_03412 [Pseudogymnoascus verrucosus]|uniref:Uncharacterized protein n=1 Tax=Pseudogymnoascus verrucosus TaxID=342668 RepID=A0A1B8GSP2_9PEZI|nr:uncharacterized protein VE01_03412 [Pseudogymnoascus verrucosus]OBT98847.1 hypothetical protein VE01_03412 [Pseudogymnoascus verrucosus]
MADAGKDPINDEAKRDAAASIAKAFQDVQAGEEAARQAEERLSRLEAKIEELLASAEAGIEGKEGLGEEMGRVVEELRGLEGGKEEKS